MGDRWILFIGSHRRWSVPTYPGFVPFDFATNLDFMIFRFKNKANIAKYELILPLFIKFYSGLLCIMMPFFRRFRGGYYYMGFLSFF